MNMDRREPFNIAGHQLDARGWLCPQPVIAARQWLEKASAGDCLHVALTDPHGPLDFEVFCARSGHQLLACQTIAETQPPEWHLLIEKSAISPELPK